MYSSEAFGELAGWCIDLMDEVADGKPEHELLKLEEIFINTTRLNICFGIWRTTKQMWPGDKNVNVSV